jgi:DNA invertase Pin-like site-specific DNA recombinase
MKQQTKYAYGYIRISSMQQAEKDGVSLDMQEKAIRKWAKRERYELVDVLKDESVSGTLEAKQRSELSRILLQLNNNDVFVTYTVSRFSRNFSDFVQTVEVIHKKGAYFASIKEGYDTRTASGVLHMNILASVAAQQAAEISTYALETAEHFRQTGRHNGHVPYGWRKRNELPGSGLEPVAEEQQIIGLIKLKRSMYTGDGLPTPYAQIVKMLAEMKIASPNKSAKWNITSLKQICERDEVRTKGRPEYEALYNGE